MNLKEIAEQVKSQPVPVELLEQATKSGYVCINPDCRSGTGDKGTGMTVNPNNPSQLHCWACGSNFRVIDVFAYHCGISVKCNQLYDKDDYNAIIRAAAEYFNLPLDDKPRAKKKATSEPKETAVFDRLDESRANLQKIIETGDGQLTWRGLTLETMVDLKWGFLPDFHFHNNPSYSLYPSVIIPNDGGGTFARVIGDPPNNLPKGDNFAPFQPTTIYLPDDTNFILVVTEGAINAASAWQAVQSVERDDKPALGFVAAGATSNISAFMEWLKKRYPSVDARPRVLVYFDNDIKDEGKNPGQAAALKLLDLLIEDGFAAANIIVDGGQGLDTNDLLQLEDGNNKLGNSIIDKVIDSRADLIRAADEIQSRKEIIDWEKDNGKIQREELDKLKADAEYLEGLSVENIDAVNASSAQTLRAVARCLHYDFRAAIAQNFFARVYKAKAAAQALVKSETPENPVADSVRALAMIDTRQITSKANGFVAEIEKAHKQYAKEHEEKLKRQQAAERESQRAAVRAQTNKLVEQAEKTTAEILGDDCPIDLNVPLGFSISEDGAICDEDGGIVVTTPILITKNLTGDDGEYVELAFRVAGSWRRRIVDKLTIADHHEIIGLATIGVTVTSTTARPLSEFLVRLLDFRHNAERIPIQRLYSQPGWTDDTFKEFVYPGSGDAAILNGSSLDYQKAFASKGKKKSWLEMYRKVASSSPAARMVIGAALLAPLIRPLGLSNQWLHLVGSSGKGKSAAAKFAASIYGSPLKLMTKFNSTANALEGSALAFNDLPNFVEELQTVNKKVRENLDGVIYNYENGTQRGRCSKNGILRPIKTFHGVRISSGEQNLTNESASGEGAYKRALELECNELFDDGFAVEVHRFVAEHYGLVGREWLEVIKRRANEIKLYFGFTEEKLREEYPDAYPNHRVFVAAALIAGYFFDKDLAGLGDNVNAPFAKTYKDAAVILGSLPKRDATTNASRAIAAVADFVNSHPYNFRVFDADGDTLAKLDKEVPHPTEIYGYKLQYGGVAIFPRTVRDILRDFPSASAIIRSFAQAGYLDSGNNSKRPYQKCVRVDGKPQWLYVFKRSALYDGDGDDDE